MKKKLKDLDRKSAELERKSSELAALREEHDGLNEDYTAMLGDKSALVKQVDDMYAQLKTCTQCKAKYRTLRKCIKTSAMNWSSRDVTARS